MLLGKARKISDQARRVPTPSGLYHRPRLGHLQVRRQTRFPQRWVLKPESRISGGAGIKWKPLAPENRDQTELCPWRLTGHQRVVSRVPRTRRMVPVPAELCVPGKSMGLRVFEPSEQALGRIYRGGCRPSLVLLTGHIKGRPRAAAMTRSLAQARGSFFHDQEPRWRLRGFFRNGLPASEETVKWAWWDQRTASKNVTNCRPQSFDERLPTA